MNTLIAIDPGAHGAIVVRHGDLVVSLNTPDTPKDTFDLLAEAQSQAAGGSIRCYMEQVSGYAGGEGQPGSAMFKFGRGFGNLEGFLIALGIPFILVMPSNWQRTLNLGKRGTERANLTGLTEEQKGMERRRAGMVNYQLKKHWKNKLKDVAQRCYPRIKVTLDNADALLLLEYARRMENLNPDADAFIPKVYREPTEARLQFNPTEYVLEHTRQLDLQAVEGCKTTSETIMNIHTSTPA